ncbi:hypothetical protein AB0T83_00355 [Fluviibacterium sp. DFM31]|uniref:Energy transducer TonB n=1 Tax=Meridianimarinicoccus marinus TaxID=3231483 RepID=A0ABV3L0Z8_9RHOB
MQTGLKFSLGGHGALILVALVGWPFAGQTPPEPLGAVDVTLIDAATLSPGALVDTPAPFEAASAPEIAAAPAADALPETPAPSDPVPEPEPLPEAEPLPDLPAPPPVDRVAPVPQPQLPEDLPEAPERQEAVEAVPEPAPEAVEAEEQEATAPEAAAPEIVTEATETALAPVTVQVPRRRPPQPDPQPDPAPVEPAPADPAPEQPAAQDPVAAALAEALGTPETEAETPTAPAASGPPLTQGEREGLRVAVGQCWNFSSLGTDAAKVTVVVAMEMGLDGRPSNLRMVSYEGGGDTAAQQAYETARRAILRCQPFDLPPEKYDQWQTIEMTFNPERMRRK